MGSSICSDGGVIRRGGRPRSIIADSSPRPAWLYPNPTMCLLCLRRAQNTSPPRFFRWSLQRDNKGAPIAMLVTNNDISERKRVEEERERLRQLEADLAHVNRVSMLGELAASLSHELKQPIAAAIINANTCMRWLARDEPDAQEAREAATRVVQDGNRAAEVINRLRSFYTKSAPAEREPVDVNEVLREMPALLRSEANRYSISMRTNLAVELPKVRADSRATAAGARESALTLGSSTARLVRIEIEYRLASLRSRAGISRRTSFTSTGSRSAGALFV